jgi:two-component system, NarL family, nitrate/nitrite sensor histidine kinase NarX
LLRKREIDCPGRGREEALMTASEGAARAIAGRSSGLRPLDDTSTRGTRWAIDLLHKVLTQLLSDPDSTEPFELVLGHILELSGAEAGAIFVSTESGHQLAPLAIAGPDDPERWMRLVAERGLQTKMNREGVSETFGDAQDSQSAILAQGFAQGRTGHGVLLLRLARTPEAVSDAAQESLQGYGEFLAGILDSARCARTRLRDAQSEERAAMARELHDSLAQSLAYMKIQVSLLQTALQKDSDRPVDIDASLQKLRTTLSTANLQLRELITTFRLTMHGRTFSQALEDSIEEFERRSSIAFDLDDRLPAGVLTVADEMQLLLILREALCNVVRHSHATYCWVSVRVKDDGDVCLGVVDDGVGLRQSMRDTEPHHGLIIMQERAYSLGGSLHIEDREGRGTHLYVCCRPQRQTASHS